MAELWEPWMRVGDKLLEDEELVDAVYEEQGSDIRRVGSEAVSKRRRRWPCAC